MPLMISKHPNPELLVEYTSGALSVAPAISITTHLQFCDHCRHLTESLTEIGGELLKETEAIPVSEGLLEEVLACLDKPVSIADPVFERPVQAVDEVVATLPQYVQQFLPEGSLAWKFLSPSLKTSVISVGEDIHELALHLIKAGGKAPEHSHRGSEITVVLKGSFSDEDGVYHPGDFILREMGEVHRPTAACNEECICLSVLAAPIRLTGIKRVFNPFLGFSPS
jgi:putative transcriptional regulator